MSKGGNNQVQQTPQQRALVDFAVNQLNDYQKRWLPVQQSLAAQIQRMGDRGSAERETATGRTTTDNAASFAQATGALERTLANNGANVNSARSKLAVTGLGDDAAKSTGLGMTIADARIDDAYTQGLQALTALGRGERAQAAEGMAAGARQSAVEANAAAEASAANRAGNYELGGMAAGFGLQRAFAQPAGNDPGYKVFADGMGTNNTGIALPTAGGR